MSAAPLLQATLDGEDLAALWRDLAVLAEIRRALVEDAQGTRACRLEEAFEALETGSARRVQIRYAFDGATWFDTLTPAPEGIRLVRISEADALRGAEGEA